MTTHHMQLKGFILPVIADGRKDLEIRVADEKRRKVNVGDLIIFSEKYRRRVNAVRSYASFTGMLMIEDPARIMPGYSSEQILSGLRQIYPAQKERLGVLVFELEVVT